MDSNFLETLRTNKTPLHFHLVVVVGARSVCVDVRHVFLGHTR